MLSRYSRWFLLGLVQLGLAGAHFTSRAGAAELVAQDKPAAVNPATVPSDGKLLKRADWYLRCAQRVGALLGKRCDVIFIGDSLTQGFVEDAEGWWLAADGVPLRFAREGFALTGRAVWEKHYTGRHVLNFGVGGDCTEHILWRMEHCALRDLQPKVVVILAGTNNTNTLEAPQVAEGVRAVLDRTRAYFPQAKVILVSLTPRKDALPKIEAINTLLRGFADGHQVHYFDLYGLMSPREGGWKGIGYDQLHFSAEGYELWAAGMEPLLTRLLTLE